MKKKNLIFKFFKIFMNICHIIESIYRNIANDNKYCKFYSQALVKKNNQVYVIY